MSPSWWSLVSAPRTRIRGTHFLISGLVSNSNVVAAVTSNSLVVLCDTFALTLCIITTKRSGVCRSVQGVGRFANRGTSGRTLSYVASDQHFWSWRPTLLLQVRCEVHTGQSALGSNVREGRTNPPDRRQVLCMFADVRVLLQKRTSLGNSIATCAIRMKGRSWWLRCKPTLLARVHELSSASLCLSTAWWTTTFRGSFDHQRN